MIFVCSMGDLFHTDVPFEFIDRVFAVMALADQHSYQILTKRPDRMREYFSAEDDLWADRWPRMMNLLCGECSPTVFPLRNVWLGTSVENQDAAESRIEDLVSCPAAVHFISQEPTLGPIDYSKRIRPIGPRGKPLWPCPENMLFGIDQVICGGESGPGARPMHPEWARSTRDQCVDAGVAFFFKQWGKWKPMKETVSCTQFVKGSAWVDTKGQLIQRGIQGIHIDLPLRLMSPVGKKSAGRLIDGRTWDEMPKVD